MQGENMKFQLTCFTLLLHTAILIYIYIYIYNSIYSNFLPRRRKKNTFLKSELLLCTSISL